MPSSQANRRNPRRNADDSGVGVTSTPAATEPSSPAAALSPNSQKQFNITEEDMMEEDEDYEAEQALLSQEQRTRVATPAAAMPSSPLPAVGDNPAR